MSSHIETGEPLPDDIFHRVEKASSSMRGTHFAATFLDLSAYDLALHHEFYPYSGSDAMFDIFRRRTQEFSPRPPFHDDKYICSLDYIFQHPSSDFSYVWSEMLATDAFACFAEAKSDDELMALGRKVPRHDFILGRTSTSHGGV
ncbi:hypothetical protein AC1031_019416 [Aphanomyces cochlioides]|nr:hypothetical protein AC1031_019416 [Aphanomyces cochlioides]